MFQPVRHYRLAERGGAGLVCDDKGLALGPVTLTEISCDAARQTRYRLSPALIVARVLRLAYDEMGDRAIAHCCQGLARVADLLPLFGSFARLLLPSRHRAVRYLSTAIALLIVYFAIPCLASSRLTDIPFKIAQDEARHLAAMGYHDDTYTEYMFAEGPEFAPPFFGFTGAGEAATFGAFAVNPWTGEAWDVRGCRRLRTPELQRKVAEIRLRFSPEELKRYKRLSRLRPACISD